MAMGNEEFYRRKFKIQDNAIRSILDILCSPNLQTTKQKQSKEILNHYNDQLKDLYDDVDRRRYD